MKNKPIVPKPLPGENEYSAFRRAYYQRYRKNLSSDDGRFETQCSRAYLKYLMTNGF